MNYYFDNACTSFPKPKEVGEYMLKHLNEGGSYGRGGYPRIFNSSKIVEETRARIASLIGAKHSENIIFTSCSTIAINTILSGYSFKFGKVLISPLEHNAVARPLENLRRRGTLVFDYLPFNMDGLVNVDALKKNDLNKVDLLIVNHISNVNGVIQPLKEIKEAVGSVPIMIDASQSLGKVAVNVDDWNIDFLAFTGHKGLLGPTGTGGCYIKEPLSIKNTLFGGTGSNSESIEMPTSMPDRFQPGTPNVTGLYGLLGALNNRPVNNWDYERLIALINNLQSIDSIKVISANDSLNQGDVFSIFPKNGRVSEFATLLFQQFGIETRSGLHCSPLAHKTIKTFPSGTVRISLSPYHTNADLDYLEQSIKAIYDR